MIQSLESFLFQSDLVHVHYKDFPPIDMKRDDMIDPIISGNKWRKLKFTLMDAQAKGKTHLISFGGAHSNHVLALSEAAARFGFRATAFIRGEEIKNNPSLMLQMAMLNGMELRYVSRQDYLNKLQLYAEHYANDPQTYFVDEGGVSLKGLEGVAEIIDELPKTYDHIFVAAGTGCTAAGLATALQQRNRTTIVHAIAVQATFDHLQHKFSELQVATKNVQFHATPEYGSYGQHTPEIIRFCNEFMTKTGIPLDAIYTAKALLFTYRYMKEMEMQGSCLFIHTGGILGNLGKIKAFEKDWQSNSISPK